MSKHSKLKAPKKVVKKRLIANIVGSDKGTVVK